MKKILLLTVAALLGWQGANAQDKVEEFGIFDHLSAGVSFGTTGIGIELAAPVSEYVQLRAGYSFMPKLSYKDDFDYKHKGQTKQTEVEAKLNMGDVKLLADIYPFPKSTFHATAGFYVGKSEIITVENTKPVTDFEPGEGFFVGDYLVGFDENGYAKGSIKVASFKPYVGLGFGRAVPRGRIGVSADFGVQFWGTPGVYEHQTGKDLKLEKEDVGDNDEGWIDKISKFTAYPVINIRICGRIF